MGYSQQQLVDIQAKWNLRFPPDLIELFRKQRVLIGEKGDIDWLSSSPETIQAALDWPFEGFMFDVEHGGVWWPEWGTKPQTLDQQKIQLRKIFDSVPKLIPLFGHRYLPQEPFESSNPIFSVYQTDVICYGANLQDWIERERGAWDMKPWPQIKEIPFWSEVVRRNGTQYKDIRN